VSSLEKYVKVRITAKRRQRWKFEATLRGQTLSQFIRTAVEAELAAPAATARAGGSGSSVSPEAHSARAPASLEERLQAAVELVDGLGVARALPHPVEGDAETEATSALERLLTD